MMKTNKFKSHAVTSEDQTGIVRPEDYKNDHDTGHTPFQEKESSPKKSK